MKVVLEAQPPRGAARPALPVEGGDPHQVKGQPLREGSSRAAPASRVVGASAPLVAIVGRPNVGKSTLFNRLCGGHHAIVEDQPGVTRDRRYGTADYDGVEFRVVDTGGLDLDAARDGAPTAAITQGILRQALRAVDEAAVVLFVMDAREGLVPADRTVVEHLRRMGKPVLYVANKVDGPKQEDSPAELYELGVETVFGVSAAHGRGVGDLLDAVVAFLRDLLPQAESAVQQDADAGADDAEGAGDPESAEASVEAGADAAAEAGEQEKEPALIRIALIGRPNAGKSSLVNQLCGEERMIVDDTPGTTRDPVDTLIEHQGQRYLLIDTAGIRRRVRVSEPMEKIAMAMAEKAVGRADVAILVIDAQAGIGEQDAKIAGLVQEAGRALIIAFNKRDLIDAQAQRKLQEELDRMIQFVPWALVVTCSAKSQRGVLRLLSEARRCYRAYTRRVSTGALNRFFEGIVERHPPPLFHGHPIRLYYITQTAVRPPTFMISVNYPQGMHFSYSRYLQNQLRESFGFVGTPVKLMPREHKNKRR